MPEFNSYMKSKVPYGDIRVVREGACNRIEAVSHYREHINKRRRSEME
jgi:hypothetical protein